MITRVKKTLSRFDRRVWLLLFAMLAPVRLRGTYLGHFGACFGVACGVSPIVAGTLLQAELPHLIWTIQLAAAACAAAGLVTLAALRHPKRRQQQQ